ncbi:MAG: glutathione S-transferase family protein [Rhizobiaceae bacterium]
MLTLFHNPMSAGSRAVRLMLSELELDAKLVTEHVWERREEFLTINPAGTVPVLMVDTLPVVGAWVICEYLDETHGALQRQRRLFPEDPVGRAEMRRIMDWCLSKFESEVTRYAVNERITKRQMPANLGGGAPDSQALRAVRANIGYHLKYLGWLASTRNWLAGDSLTQADLTAAATLSVLDYLGEIDWTTDNDLKDWYMRVKSRPSFRPLLADRIRGMPPVSHYVDLDF